MKLDDEAFSFDIISQPDLDFSACEYLGTCEYLRVCTIIRKRDFFFGNKKFFGTIKIAFNDVFAFFRQLKTRKKKLYTAQIEL